MFDPSSVIDRPSEGRRRKDIQGLRALAVCLVVAFHANLPLHGGFVGVDVFFVISGFVIARLLLSELRATDSIGLRSFYARRMRRLLPALALVVLVVALAASLLLSPLGAQQANANTAIGASLFGANFQLFRTPVGYFDLDATANALLHTWSLSVEEQFYFVFPLALLLAWRIGAKCTRGSATLPFVTAVAVLATAASFGFSWLVSHGHGTQLADNLGGSQGKLAFYMPMSRAWEFGVGIVVALLTSMGRRPGRTLAAVLGVSGFALIIIGAVNLTDRHPFPGIVALMPVVGTALVIAAGASERPTFISSFLSLRPIVWIGDVSYGWYLWHWPLIVFVRALWADAGWLLTAAALVALGPTWLSYRYLENPIRFDGRIAGYRAFAVAIVCVGISTAAGGALLVVSRLEASTPSATELSAALNPHGDQIRGCNRGPRLGTSHPAACRWMAERDDRGTVVLVGDSNAGQFTEPVAHAANRQGFGMALATFWGCPFVDLTITGLDAGTAACRQFVHHSLSTLEQGDSALVIVATASTWYVNDNKFTIIDPLTGEEMRTPEAKARLWEIGVRSVVERLSRAGVPTLVVHTIPQLDSLSLETCPFLRIWKNVDACGESMSRSAIEAQQRLARDADRNAIASIPGVRAIDFTDDLCSPETCASRIDGDWIYRNAGHLSIVGALRLTDRFAGEIARHATPVAARVVAPAARRGLTASTFTP